MAQHLISLLAYPWINRRHHPCPTRNNSIPAPPFVSTQSVTLIRNGDSFSLHTAQVQKRLCILITLQLSSCSQLTLFSHTICFSLLPLRSITFTLLMFCYEYLFIMCFFCLLYDREIICTM